MSKPLLNGRNTTPERECENCGGYVTKQFVRVFGTGGRVYGCMSCMTGKQLRNGEASTE